MAQAKDLYQVLGVGRDATQEDIKKAFRRLAREHHPDVSGDPESEHRFKEVNLAYETLSDPEKRRRYDTFGGEGFTPDMFNFGDITEVFEAFFGGGAFGGARTRGVRRTRTGRGSDLHLALDLAFEEAAFGVTREVRIDRLTTCERCAGTGAEPGTSAARCGTCDGTGQVSDVRRSVFGTVMTSRACGICQGTGEVIPSPCPECRGAGVRPGEHMLQVEVPPGVADGMDLRLPGRGEDGRHGGGPGDLYVSLRVAPHPVFAREGADLHATLEVPVTQALLGGEVEVETLDGKEVVKILPGTRAGTVFRLRGVGVPNVGRRGRGDLYLEVDLAIPDGLSKKERRLVEDLADLRGEAHGKGPAPGRLRRRG